MSDLISRAEVIEALKLLTDEGDPYDEGYNLGLNTAILEVKKCIPAAEPKVGKWIEVRFKTVPTNRIAKAKKCSICGKRKDKYVTWNYCPNCGAKMKGNE